MVDVEEEVTLEEEDEETLTLLADADCAILCVTVNVFASLCVTRQRQPMPEVSRADMRDIRDTGRDFWAGGFY